MEEDERRRQQVRELEERERGLKEQEERWRKQRELEERRYVPLPPTAYTHASV